jgi:hypothetical protein
MQECGRHRPEHATLILGAGQGIRVFARGGDLDKRPAKRPLECRAGTVNLSGSDQLESRVLAVCSRNLVPTHAADFGPDLESLAPASSVLGSSHVIAAEMEEVIDLIVG